MRPQSPCPCGSGILLTECCQPFLNGDARPETAEQLMRSRFTAFFLGDEDYIILTTHPAKRKDDDIHSIRNTIRNCKWLELFVLNTKNGSVNDQKGTVEFIAAYLAVTQGLLHEISSFKKIDGLWYYVDGEVQNTPIPGRNDPCWCSSGKKHKKCHGRA